MRYPFVSKLLAEIAPEVDARVELEPEFGYAGEIFFANGKRCLLQNATLDLNTSAASKLTKDKAYTAYILQKYQISTPQTQTFFSEQRLLTLFPQGQRGLAAACDYAQSLGYPVIVKPNDLSQGQLICKVHNEEELRAATAKIWARVPVLLVQAFCPGRDYRVVVLNGQVRVAYERRPLTLVGDGQLSIAQLIDRYQAQLIAAGRTSARIERNELAIALKLAQLNLTRESILPAGTTLALLDNTNLSTGGEAIDVTETIHLDYRELAVKVTEMMGLRLSGVDILCPNLEQPCQNYWVLEVNGSPGLDNYATLGEAQAQRVRQLYRQALLDLAAI